MPTGCQYSESCGRVPTDHLEIWWQICFKNLCSLSSAVWAVFYYSLYCFRTVSIKPSPGASSLSMTQSKIILLCCTSFQHLNCGCKAFLQFTCWFLTVTGSKEDLKGILTLQPTCSIFHLQSYVPTFQTLPYPGKLGQSSSQWAGRI